MISVKDRVLLGDHRAVVNNIEQAVRQQTFTAKVETGDPQLSRDEASQLLQKYEIRRHGLMFKTNTLITRKSLDIFARIAGRGVRVEGASNLRPVTGGAIVTSNHFSPVENLFVRKAIGRHRLHIVSQLTNLKMSGWLGYLMNYADTLPISTEKEWMGREFPKLLGGYLERGDWALIYPEQEMWFNYTKPRPPQRGAYYFAAQFNKPIVSCFISMQTQPSPVTDDFDAVQYTVHVLKPLWPDPQLDVRTASKKLQAADYAQKKAAYEQAYGRKLSYDFTPQDIAGWRHE